MDFLFLYMMFYNINKVLEHFDKVKFWKKVSHLTGQNPWESTKFIIIFISHWSRCAPNMVAVRFPPHHHQPSKSGECVWHNGKPDYISCPWMAIGNSTDYRNWKLPCLSGINNSTIF